MHLIREWGYSGSVQYISIYYFLSMRNPRSHFLSNLVVSGTIFLLKSETKEVICHVPVVLKINDVRMKAFGSIGE